MNKINFFVFLFFFGVVSCTNSEKTNFSQTQDEASILLEKGIENYKTGNFETADSLFRIIIDKTALKDNEQLIIRANTNLGNIYADKGNNPLALQYYNKALKLAESAKDTKNTAYIQKNIGTLYV